MNSLPGPPADTGSVPRLWHGPGGGVAGGPLVDTTWRYHGRGSKI